MKWITILLMLSFPATATEDPCMKLYNAADAIMTARQGGAEAHAVVAIVREAHADEVQFKLYMKVVTDAYSYIRFTEALYQKETIIEFSNKYYMMCWRHRV